MQLKINPPYRFLTIHTVLILLCMISFYNRLFLTDIPFDCFYVPFFLVSGPFIYIIAHFAQHLSEPYFNVKQIDICWNIIPGTICFILGGIQWLGIEILYLSAKNKKRNKTETEQIFNQ